MDKQSTEETKELDKNLEVEKDGHSKPQETEETKELDKNLEDEKDGHSKPQETEETCSESAKHDLSDKTAKSPIKGKSQHPVLAKLLSQPPLLKKDSQHKVEAKHPSDKTVTSPIKRKSQHNVEAKHPSDKTVKSPIKRKSQHKFEAKHPSDKTVTSPKKRKSQHKVEAKLNQTGEHESKECDKRLTCGVSDAQSALSDKDNLEKSEETFKSPGETFDNKKEESIIRITNPPDQLTIHKDKSKETNSETSVIRTSVIKALSLSEELDQSETDPPEETHSSTHAIRASVIQTRLSHELEQSKIGSSKETFKKQTDSSTSGGKDISENLSTEESREIHENLPAEEYGKIEKHLKFHETEQVYNKRVKQAFSDTCISVLVKSNSEKDKVEERLSTNKQKQCADEEIGDISKAMLDLKIKDSEECKEISPSSGASLNKKNVKERPTDKSSIKEKQKSTDKSVSVQAAASSKDSSEKSKATFQNTDETSDNKKEEAIKHKSITDQSDPLTIHKEIESTEETYAIRTSVIKSLSLSENLDQSKIDPSDETYSQTHEIRTSIIQTRNLSQELDQISARRGTSLDNVKEITVKEKHADNSTIKEKTNLSNKSGLATTPFTTLSPPSKKEPFFQIEGLALRLMETVQLSASQRKEISSSENHSKGIQSKTQSSENANISGSGHAELSNSVIKEVPAVQHSLSTKSTSEDKREPHKKHELHHPDTPKRIIKSPKKVASIENSPDVSLQERQSKTDTASSQTQTVSKVCEPAPPEALPQCKKTATPNPLDRRHKRAFSTSSLNTKSPLLHPIYVLPESKYVPIEQYHKDAEFVETQRLILASLKKYAETTEQHSSIQNLNLEKGPKDMRDNSNVTLNPTEVRQIAQLDPELPAENLSVSNLSPSKVSKTGSTELREYPGLADEPAKVKKDARYQKKFYKKGKVKLPVDWKVDRISTDEPEQNTDFEKDQSEAIESAPQAPPEGACEQEKELKEYPGLADEPTKVKDASYQNFYQSKPVELPVDWKISSCEPEKNTNFEENQSEAIESVPQALPEGDREKEKVKSPENDPLISSKCIEDHKNEENSI